MYGAGALAWYQAECDDLEVLQNEMGKWIWGVGINVRNELVRGETGFSMFQEREAKAMCDDLEVLQNEMGRWIWGVRINVRNELVRGETGFSTFQEREVKAYENCV